MMQIAQYVRPMTVLAALALGLLMLFSAGCENAEGFPRNNEAYPPEAQIDRPDPPPPAPAAGDGDGDATGDGDGDGDGDGGDSDAGMDDEDAG